VQTEVTFLDCPAFMDATGASRCGLPAEVEYRYTMRSTGGALESAKIRCPRGHWFNGPIEALTWHKEPHGGASRPGGQPAVPSWASRPHGGFPRPAG
jgi:hypothetical protein